MLIYAVADIHGRKLRISSILDTVSEKKPDVLVLAGDINRYFKSSGTISSFGSLSLPVLAVRGNTDSKKVENSLCAFPNISFLNFSEKVINGFTFTGVGGTVPVPFASRIKFSESSAIKQLETIVKKDSILIAHPPPRGTLDEVLGKFHAGCSGLNDIVKKCRPILLICGHIHERPGSAFLGNTLVVNCSMGMKGKGALIKVDKEKPPVVEMV
jgi:hypothetical protein